MSTANPSTEAEKWDQVITPRHGDVWSRLAALWDYRHLAYLLGKRNITLQYKQMVMGSWWFVIQPLLATAVFSFVFGRLAGLGTDNIPHYLFYMSGIVFFNYFSENVNRIASTFTKNGYLFSKVYFPRLTVPCGQVLTNLAGFGVQFCAFLVGMLFYLLKMRYFPDAQHPIYLNPRWQMIYLPWLLLQLTFFGAGLGMIVAALTTKYRDLQLAVPFAVQLCMYASSVVFPLSRIKGANLVALLKLNPVVPVIEEFRYAFLGAGDVTNADLLMSCVTSSIIFALGLVMYTRAEQTVADTL